MTRCATARPSLFGSLDGTKSAFPPGSRRCPKDPMSQINVNPGHEPVEMYDASGDRTAAAGINLITVLIVLAVLAVIAWYLFTGPLRGLGAASSTNVNVNPAP